MMSKKQEITVGKIEQLIDDDNDKIPTGQVLPQSAIDASDGELLANMKLAASAKNTETVNHPEHYGGDTVYETIKVIDAWRLNFNLGNAVKYISRAGKKDKTKTLEDLKKARWYLDREIQSLEAKK